MQSFKEFLSDNDMQKDLNERIENFAGSIQYKGKLATSQAIFNTDFSEIEKEFQWFFNQNDRDGAHINAFFNVLNRMIKVKEHFSAEHMVINLKRKYVLFVSDSAKLSFIVEW